MNNKQKAEKYMYTNTTHKKKGRTPYANATLPQSRSSQAGALA